jgi:hypothetical protein
MVDSWQILIEVLVMDISTNLKVELQCMQLHWRELGIIIGRYLSKKPYWVIDREVIDGRYILAGATQFWHTQFSRYHGAKVVRCNLGGVWSSPHALDINSSHSQEPYIAYC